MRTSDINKRRAELVERLVKAVDDAKFYPSLSDRPQHHAELELRDRFTALLASRWQT
jgi:hypothetical protein